MIEKISITTKDILFAKTIITIIIGELKNWGYYTTDIQPKVDPWGEQILEIEVKHGE